MTNALHDSNKRLIPAVLLLLAGALLVSVAPDRRWPELRKKIGARLFVPSPLPSLNTESRGEFSRAPGVVAERIVYRTEFGLKVPAVIYRPAARGTKLPAMIVVNGHGGDKYSWYSFYTGILYARAGAVVLTYDPIGEGERNMQRKSGTRAHDRYVPPPEMAQRMGGLMITDVMQAVSYLRGRADVDPKRIAALGYSMGSFVLSIACALDTRIHACVLVGGGDLDGKDGYWDTNSKKMCQSIPYQTLSFLGDRPAALYTLEAQRGPALVFNGSADEVVEIPTHGSDFFRDLRARAIESAGSNRNVFDYAFEPGGGHRPYWLTKPVALWLNKHLRFPDWSGASIERMPETHVSEWAKANGVPMDKGYSDEHREGGTMALGTGVPNVPRSALNVFSEAGWAEEKADLILETWLERAKLAVEKGKP